MSTICFKKGCKHEAHYVCLCLCCKTYCCEFHLEAHLKLSYRTHYFDSIWTEICEWTKVGILEFLSKEKVKKEKLKKIVLASFSQNCWTSITKSIREIDADLEKINDLIEKIAQVPEEKERVLNLSLLMSNTNSERAKAILPEPYQSVMTFCISIELRHKKSVILNRVNNDLETEKDFRRTFALYKNLTSDPFLSEIFEYIDAYHKITSLYNVNYAYGGIPELFIYNTEKESEEIRILEFPRPRKISGKEHLIKFPNGDLFFVSSNIPYIIDASYRVREMTVPEYRHDAVFFNRSIYCFEEMSENPHLWQFNLDERRWSKLAATNKSLDACRSSTIFNGNIIFSVNHHTCLLSYSIDIDSFSEIPLEFWCDSSFNTLFNAENRLYLIQSWGFIYESEVGNEYSWKKTVFVSFSSQLYCSYNKGVIYISSICKDTRDYFKFDLVSKTLINIDCYRKHLALKQLDDKIEVIEWYNQTFKLDSDLADFYYDKGYKLDFLANQLDEIESCSRDIIKKGDNNAQAYYDKAENLHSIGRNLEAIEYFNQAIRINPEFKNERNCLYEIAVTLQHLGRYHEAVEYFNEAIKLKPRKWMLFFKKGLVFHEFGKCLEAIECYNEAINLAKLKYHNQIYFRKGCALCNLGMNFEAIECYNKAIEISPKNCYYYFIRANLLRAYIYSNISNVWNINIQAILIFWRWFLN